MSSINYNLQFNKLCDTLHLGKLLDEPTALTGGHMHKMFALQTTVGKYAVKALNPSVMLRPEALQNTMNSELIANIAAKNISALPAKIFDGKSVQKIDGQYFMVFDWIDGRTLSQNEITILHCEAMGKTLAELHTIDFSSLGLIDTYSSEEKLVNWNFYLQKGKETNVVWTSLYESNIEKLYLWNDKLISAAKQLSGNTTISHGDLEPKNTMLIEKDEEIIVIDWEAAGFVNPMHDLIETAIYWSGERNEILNKDKFLSFIGGYKSISRDVGADWKTVLEKGYSNKLGWLEYSLKRSIGIESSDEAEMQMGTKHVIGTINELNKYDDTIVELQKWLDFTRKWSE